MDDTVLIIGAGFSRAAGIPTTSELSSQFLSIQETQATPEPLQSEITQQLSRFWQVVFGYKNNDPPPSFEDHFTILDLAANAGHNLGSTYWPSRLRAIRRLSIHRVFDILDIRFKLNHNIRNLLEQLASGSGNAVVSTNWDIVVENHLDSFQAFFDYGIPIDYIDGSPGPSTGLPILKLHGSSNWAYCDCYRRLYTFKASQGKGSLHSWTFLESRDFRALPGQGKNVSGVLRARQSIKCPKCNVRLSARVATFSFDKALGYFQFQGVWEETLRRLRRAGQWIFVGYSLPDADFELRHMLKTAELAEDKTKRPKITVVLHKDKAAMQRYQQFFGSRIDRIVTEGLDKWFQSLTHQSSGRGNPRR